MQMQLSAIPTTLWRLQITESKRERARRFAATAVTAIAATSAVLIVSLGTVLLGLA